MVPLPSWSLKPLPRCLHSFTLFSMNTDNPTDRLKKQLSTAFSFHTYLLEMSCAKHWKWDFPYPKFKNLLGQLPQIDSANWSAFGTLTFLSLHTPSKSHAMPLIIIVKVSGTFFTDTSNILTLNKLDAYYNFHGLSAKKLELF